MKNENLKKENKNTEKNSALVFVHGIGSLGKHFSVIIDELPSASIKIVMERPGYDKKNGAICETLQELSNDVSSEIDNLNYERMILIGHSFGGVLSLLSANKNKKIKAIVLISSFLKFHINLDDTDVLNVDMLKHGFFESTDKRIINKFIDDYKTINLKAVFREHSYCQNLDLSAEFNKLKIPVLIIHGFDDAVVSVRQAYKMFHALENSTLILLNTCGHNSIIEKPQNIAKHITEFVNAL